MPPSKDIGKKAPPGPLWIFRPQRGSEERVT